MSHDSRVIYRDATIASNGTVSAAITLQSQALVGFRVPATWTTAEITLRVADDIASATTYTAHRLLRDNVLTEFQVSSANASAAQGDWVNLLPADVANIREFKIGSGTFASAVTQAASRTITLALREVL